MIRINLLTDRHAKDRRIIQQQIVLGMVAAVVVGFLCIGYYVTRNMELSNIKESIKEAEAEKKKLESIKKQVQEMEERQKVVEAILKTIDKLRKMKAGPTPYLDSVNMIMPQEVWLTQLSDNNGQIRAEGFSFSPQAVAEFMKRLAESGDFGKVELKVTEAVSLKGKLGNKEFTRDVQKFQVSFRTAQSVKEEEERLKEEEAAEKGTKGKKKKKKKRKKAKSGGH